MTRKLLSCVCKAIGHYVKDQSFSVAIDFKLPSNEILIFSNDGSSKLADRSEISGSMSGFSLGNADQLSKRS